MTYKDEFNAINRELSASKRAAGVSQSARRRLRAATFQQPVEDIADNRTLTARFCGDPLPGRSALDQRLPATRICT